MKIKSLSYDVIFKAVFMKEKDVLLQMIKDILEIDNDIKIEDTMVMPGFEVEPFNALKKTFKTDILIKLNDDTYVNLEINKRNNSDILSRNILQVSRIYSNILDKGVGIKELSFKRLKQLNLNTFSTYTGKEIEHIALCEIESGKVVSEIMRFCNVDIAKCAKRTYNVDIERLSKGIRWGAVIKSESIEEMEKLLEGDMLSMEKKEKFLETVKEVNKDPKIIEEWIFEDNARLDYEGGIEYAKSEGKEESKIEVIKNMLKEHINYDLITKITGKTKEDIKLIEDNM